VGNGPSPIVAAACLASELAPAWASSKGRPGQPY
jgi:hypothetical protein